MFDKDKCDGFASFNGWVAIGQARNQAALTAQFTMVSGKTQHVSVSRLEILAHETKDMPKDQKQIIMTAYHSRL